MRDAIGWAMDRDNRADRHRVVVYVNFYQIGEIPQPGFAYATRAEADMVHEFCGHPERVGGVAQEITLAWEG